MWCLQGTPLSGSRYTGTLSGDEQTVQTQRKQLLDNQAKGELNNGEQCEFQGLLLRMTLGQTAEQHCSATPGRRPGNAVEARRRVASHACILCMCQIAFSRIKINYVCSKLSMSQHCGVADQWSFVRPSNARHAAALLYCCLLCVQARAPRPTPCWTPMACPQTRTTSQVALGSKIHSN